MEQEQDILTLRHAGFFWIKKSKDGTYCATHNKTTYHGLYIVNGIIKQA
jgi:hypothetical protein